MAGKSWSPGWIHDKGLRTLYFLLVIPLLSSSYQGFDGMIMNGLQLLPPWQKGNYYEFEYLLVPPLFELLANKRLQSSIIPLVLF
jgi:hypothetical protein